MTAYIFKVKINIILQLSMEITGVVEHLQLKLVGEGVEFLFQTLLFHVLL